jgi:hypothetical protein
MNKLEKPPQNDVAGPRGRHKTTQVMVGNVAVGGGAPIVVQSMTNTDTADVESFGGLVVVFDVIGAQALASVMNIDIIVGDEEIALPALRPLCRKLGDTALGRGRADLLGLCGVSVCENQNEKEQPDRKKKLERGKYPSMRVAIHAENSKDRISWIA